jgi:hypothetical protein
VGGAAANKTLYERVQLNVTGRLDIIQGSPTDARMVKVSGRALQSFPFQLNYQHL